MRKPVLILLSVLIFCLFTVLGFLTASNWQEGAPTELSINKGSPTAYQQNLLLIQVDHLGETHPVLKSVWLAGVFRSSNQTIVSFSQPYPASAGDSAFKDMAQLFKIDSAGNPDRSFFNHVKNRGVDWQGYALTDEDGGKFLNQWLRSQGAPLFDPSDAGAKTLLDAVCHLINGGYSGSAATSDGLGWETFTPHFKSDVKREELQSDWQKLFAPSPKPTHCEIITQ